MQRSLILSALFFGIFMMGCGSNSSVKNDTSNKQVSIERLQKNAEAFIPKIGKTGGSITLSSFSDPKSFNPITSTETTTSTFTAFMYEGLVRISGVTQMPEPNLAEKWDILDSGLTWIFHIRPNILWSDSVPFSAYDVEFTFNELVYNKNINPNSSRDMFTIEGKEIKVTAMDSLTVKFELPVQFAPLLRMLAQEILPKHKLEKFVKSNSFSTALGITTNPKDMVGTGAFMLDSYISSQKVVFKKNPLYWRNDAQGNKLPYLDRVVYLIVTDQNAEVLRFKRGDIDFLSARGQDYPGLKKDEQNGNYTVYRLGPASGSNFIFFNQNLGKDSTGKPYLDTVKQKWFRNKNFRKAVAYAIDKNGMIRALMNGLGYPQWGPMTPSEGYFFNPDVQKYPYNIEKAKELLKQEGFKDSNGDGIFEDPDGNIVEFSFLTNSGNNVRVKIAEMIRKDLEQLGFKVHFSQVEFNTLVQKIDNPPFAWDAILLGLTGGPEPHLGMNVWYSSSTLHMWYPRQEKPATPWEAKIDSLFVVGVKELDRVKRKQIYDEWQRIAADELPLIYTVLSERISCIRNTFGNINPSPNGSLLHNLEYIYKKTDN